jgi:hypothetical protein
VEGIDIKQIIRDTVRETLAQAEAPEYMAALRDETRRRESLERRVNELVAELRCARESAKKSELASVVRAELARVGVGDTALWAPAIIEQLERDEAGHIVSKAGQGLRAFVDEFVGEHTQ